MYFRVSENAKLNTIKKLGLTVSQRLLEIFNFEPEWPIDPNYSSIVAKKIVGQAMDAVG